MLEVDNLNRQFMPYVSRARTHGGPTLFKAIGPALLTTKWLEHSTEIKAALTARFGIVTVATAALTAVNTFLLHRPELRDIVLERFKEIYE